MNSESMTPGQEPEAPTSTSPSAHTSAHANADVKAKAQTSAPIQSGPRSSPIVWGALILAFCGYVVQRTLAPGNLDTTTWITTVTIGLGVLLLGVGAAVLIRNQRRPTQPPEHAAHPSNDGLG